MAIPGNFLKARMPRTGLLWVSGAALILNIFMWEYPLPYEIGKVDAALRAINLDRVTMEFGVCKDRSTVEIFISDADKSLAVYVRRNGALVSAADYRTGATVDSFSSDTKNYLATALRRRSDCESPACRDLALGRMVVSPRRALTHFLRKRLLNDRTYSGMQSGYEVE